MTAVVMILALLTQMALALLLALLEPIGDRNVLRRVLAIAATRAVLAACVAAMGTVLFVYGPIVRSPNVGCAVEQEQTNNPESGIQIDPTSRLDSSTSRLPDENEQTNYKDTPMTRSDSSLMQAIDMMPVCTAFLIGVVIVYGAARNTTLLSRKIAGLLAIGFSLPSTIGLVRFVGYSTEIHHSHTSVGAVQDTWDVLLLPVVASTLAMLFACVLVPAGKGLLTKTLRPNDQDAGLPANRKVTRLKTSRSIWERLTLFTKREKQSSEPDKVKTAGTPERPASAR